MGILRKQIRTFWGEHEAKFKKVWAVLDTQGKTKFANACLQAAKQVCAETEVLVPEIDVDRISQDESHIYQLFYYYFTNDGIERDREFVDDAIESGLLTHPEHREHYLMLRQMLILKCLARTIEIYEAVWMKGTEATKTQQNNTGDLQAVMERQQHSLDNNTCFRCAKVEAASLCARCKKVKYCGRDCQVADWKTHKPFCKKETPKSTPIDEKAILKKKLEEKKRLARGEFF